MTEYENLEPPKDAYGRVVEKNERRNAEGLSIPLLVGSVRNADAGLAVDAVFHPWVMQRCLEDNTFKAQVIDLAIQWVEQETNLKVEKQWKTIRSTYKGGSGDGSEAMPFPVEQAMFQV